MKERGILFKAPMVRAILDDRKTQTRRICKLQPHEAAGMTWWPDGHGTDTGTLGGAPGCYLKLSPYGQPGDRLWVRENFCPIYPQDPHYNGGRPIEYDYAATYQHGYRLGDLIGEKKKWMPSIHMPRIASRILLEINDVRVERLNDISEADAIAEGVIPKATDEAINGYRMLWESINGHGSWQANPWVWVIIFKRVAA